MLLGNDKLRPCRHGADKEKIHVIRCGVDSGSFKLKKRVAAAGTPKIGALGRMVEKKGFDLLLKSSEILMKEGMSFNVEIVGDGPMLEYLHGLSRSLDVGERVSFPGTIAHDQVPAWLKGLDLFVLPCRKDSRGDMDGVPVVLMEAMLYGIPVISTRLSGIPELVVNEDSGLLVAPDDPEGLSVAIKTILSDHSLWTKIRDNGIKKVRSEFDLGRNVDKLADLFRKEIL